MKNKIDALILLSYALFLLLPFAYMTELQDAELTPRLILLSAIGLFISLFVLIETIRQKTILRFPAVPIISLFLFIAFLIISFFRSRVYADAWPEFIRMMLLFNLFLIFLYGLKTRPDFFRHWLIALTSGVVIFLLNNIIELWQNYRLHLEKPHLNIISFNTASFFGNKNLYAETLMLSLPFLISAALLFKRKWKIIPLILSVLCISIILAYNSNAATIALVVFILISGALIFSSAIINWPVRQKWIAGITVFGMLAGGIIISGSGKKIFEKISSIKKTEEIEFNTPFQISAAGSVSDRLIMWKNSYSLITESPLTGVGLSNWKILYPAYGSTRIAHMNAGHIRSINPHNDYLLIAAEAGIPALLCFLILLFSALWIGLKFFKKSDNTSEKIIFSLMIGGISGWMVIAFFSFPMSRYFQNILMLMMIAILINKKEGKPDFSKVFKIVMVIGILLSTAGLNTGIKRLKAETLFSKAMLEQKKGQLNSANYLLSQIDTTILPLDYTATPIDWNRGVIKFYLNDIPSAIKHFQEAENINPFHTQVLNDLGSCYNLTGKSAKALEYFQRVFELAPLHPGARLNAAIVHYNSNEIDSAFYHITQPCLFRDSNYDRALEAILFAKAQKELNGNLKLSGKELVSLFRRVNHSPTEFIDSLKTNY